MNPRYKTVGRRARTCRHVSGAYFLADTRHRRFPDLLLRKHFVEPYHSPRDARAPSQPGSCFRPACRGGRRFVGSAGSFSIIAPSFQAGDLIKLLGIGSVAIGFAFQNILQNFLAGLLLLWAETFRVGDQIKLDNFEGTVEDIQTRATTIKTYDGRRVVVPNAELFTSP